MLKFISQTETETDLQIGDLIKYGKTGRIEVIHKIEKQKNDWRIKYLTFYLQDLDKEYFYSSDWHTIFKIK